MMAQAAGCISIHVPLAGDDSWPVAALLIAANFYPRPPCGGRRKYYIEGVPADDFYPRPPCGGRPPETMPTIKQPSDFYPRPPCGGRQPDFQYHTWIDKFLSTSPLRGTTVGPVLSGPVILISIHVPLAGDDVLDLIANNDVDDFYPRPPCGGRLAGATAPAISIGISIHVPLAGDDGGRGRDVGGCQKISIHVPLAGDDRRRL